MANRTGLSARNRAQLELPKKPDPLQHPSQIPDYLLQTLSDEKHVENGGFYSQPAVDYQIDLLQRYIVHASGDQIGQPFIPSEWQVQHVLNPLFGWHNDDGSRRFRRSYIQGGKKVTGKSTLAAALSCTALLEMGAEVYQIAATKNQASTVTFNMTVNMVELGDLDLYIDTRPYKGQIVFDQLKSRLNTVSCKPFSGPSPTFMVMDELHEWREVNALSVWNSWVHAGLARKNSLIFVITNAGDDLDSLAYRQFLEAQEVQQSRTVDPELYTYLCQPSSLDDAKQEILNVIEGADELPVLKAMSPHLDEVTSERAIAAQIRSSCKEMDGEQNCLRFFYCCWVQGADRDWLGPIFAKTAQKYDENDVLGRDCYAGFDRAVSRDMTSLVLFFPRESPEEPDKLLPFFWLPDLRVKVLRKFVPGFKQWVDAGQIRIMPGAVFDYDLFWADYQEICRRYNQLFFVYDPHKADVIGAKVESDFGIERLTFSQSNRNYHQFTTEFEDRMNRGEIVHPDHPVLNWQAQNAVRHTDLAGYVRPTKRSTTDWRTVDGIQCSIMAFAAHMQNEQYGASYYDENDVEMI